MTGSAPARPRRRGLGVGFAALLFSVVALAVYADARLSVTFISYKALPHDWPDHRWLDTFARYDSGWYWHIAHLGYFYDGPGKQAAVAFFPAYPTLMRVVGAVAVDAIIAGILVTLACGLGASVLFYRWAVAFLGRRPARFALALLLLYPFAFYLMGAVYSDALFLLAAVGAFSLVEHDRPVLAGLVGIIATADRPVGIALVIGLAVRQAELAGVLPGSRRRAFAPPVDGRTDAEEESRRFDEPPPHLPLVPRRIRPGLVRARDLGVLLSVLGLVLFCGYLWYRFREPFAFLKVGSSVGWYRKVDLHTIAKIDLYRRWQGYGLNIINFWLTMQGLFSLIALASIPGVIRRFGWGYGAFTLVAVGMAFVSTPDFVGMGRYVVVAFPVFAFLGDRLARASGTWRPVPAVVLTISAGLLAWMASLYARWYFLA
jgi:hypothetical protein